MNRALLLLLLLGILSAPAARAEQWPPWDVPAEPSRKAPAQASVYNPLKQGVRFFQKFISPVDGPRCPLYPTCSAYALQALDKHGPLVGTMLTVDRLYRESDKREHTHPRDFPDRTRYRDLLEENDFWFDRSNKSDKI